MVYDVVVGVAGELRRYLVFQKTAYWKDSAAYLMYDFTNDAMHGVYYRPRDLSQVDAVVDYLANVFDTEEVAVVKFSQYKM